MALIDIQRDQSHLQGLPEQRCMQNAEILAQDIVNRQHKWPHVQRFGFEQVRDARRWLDFSVSMLADTQEYARLFPSAEEQLFYPNGRLVISDSIAAARHLLDEGNALAHTVYATLGAHRVFIDACGDSPWLAESQVAASALLNAMDTALDRRGIDVGKTGRQYTVTVFPEGSTGGDDLDEPSAIFDVHRTHYTGQKRSVYMVQIFGTDATAEMTYDIVEHRTTRKQPPIEIIGRIGTMSSVVPPEILIEMGGIIAPQDVPIAAARWL